MKTTTQAFKDAISAPGRDLTATLLFPGRAFGVTEIKDIKIQENLLSGEDFEIGKAPKFSIDFEIWDRDKTLNFDFKDKEFTLLFGIKTYLDSDSNHSTLAQYTHEQLSQLIHGNIRFQGVEDVPFGIYKVTSADYKEGAYTVHAENRMSKAEVLYTDDGVYPKTVLQVVQRACELSGITLINTVFANIGYSIPNAPVYEGITCRQIFAYASELAGGYAVINRTGELEIRTLGTAISRTVGKSNYIELTETQDAIGNINKVIVRTGEQEAVQGTGTNMYTIQDNIFVQNPENVIAELYTVLSQVNYTALDLEWQGDFSLDMGDKVDVDGKLTYLLNRTLDFQGGLRETYTSPAKNNVDKKSSGKQSMIVQIARVRTEIKVVDGKISQKITDDNGKFTLIDQDIDSIELSINATTHSFTELGYELKDDNGASLITPNGMANEQNFSSTQNVEDGYPLNMSFRIGDSTSVITKVELRLKQYPFRTDSKGAASGGGSTSGPSSKSTSDQVWENTSGTGITVSETNGIVGDTHRHVIGFSQFAHAHGMAHIHTTPAHGHNVIFGILEYPNDNGTIEVDINGVRRTGTTNTDITLDITTWITTNGVHNISLRSPNLKRIQCDVYIKSYIRR